MSFGGAHDFNIDTANMGSTNSGPLMFWNNTYQNGATHNQAIATGGSPATLYVGSPSPARSRLPRGTSTPRIPEREGSEYSRDSRSTSSANSSLDEPRPRLIAPQSDGRGRSRSSDASLPVQPPYSSSAPLDRQQSEYSSYSSPETRSHGPPLPPSTPSYRLQDHPASPGGSQAYQQAEAWTPSPKPQSPNAQAQPSPQALYPEIPSLRRSHGPPGSQPVPSGSPFGAGDDSFYAETETRPPAAESQPSPGVVAQSSSDASQDPEVQDHVIAKKKRTFWQRMTSWGHKKSEKSIKKRQ